MKLYKYYKFLIGILIIFLLIAIRYSGLNTHLTIQTIQQKRELLLYIVNHYYSYSVISYILLYILIVALALPLAAVCTITGGFLFGVFPAVIYTNIGATVGATFFFLFVRFFWGQTLQSRYKNSLKRFNRQMHKYGAFYLIAIHLVAIIPFFLVNVLIGLTNVSVFTFIWTTMLGILPGSFIYAFAGRQLASIESIKDVFSCNILLALILLAFLAILPVLIQQYREWGLKKL